MEFLGPTIAPMTQQPLTPHVKLESVDRVTQRIITKENDAFNEIRQVVGQKLHKIKVPRYGVTNKKYESKNA